MKIFIPIIEEWQGIRLEKDNLKEFEKFIKNNGYDLHYFEVDGELKNIIFKWNPYGEDYPETVKVEVGEIFMYSKEEKGLYFVIDKMQEHWTILEE